MVVGGRTAGYYGYDAKGDRIYKLLGKCSIDDFRANRTNAATLLDNAVLYPNPYITITKKDYYKHYYWGAERFATIIGKGGFDMMSTDAISTLSQNEATKKDAILERYHTDFPLGELYFEPWQNMDIDTRVDENLQYHCPQTQLFQIKVEYDQDLLLGIIHDNVNLNEQEKDIYYTSANHLGSSSWITRNDGQPIQYIHYLPYGQLLANQRIALYNERYKFTGKERDGESGYDYFGARYYNSSFMHWMSVDPLSDKYPGISPYAYCHWNPVKFIDPDGREKKAFFSNAKDQINNRHFANQFKDDNRLHIFSHGNQHGLVLENNNQRRDIHATKEGAQIFSDILTNGADASELWNNYLRGENSEPLQVVLHGCYTASMAEALSKEFPDVYFTGTTEENHSQGTKELGPYSTYNILGILKTDWKKADGQWNTYKDGNLIKVETNPSASPLTFDEQNGTR